MTHCESGADEQFVLLPIPLLGRIQDAISSGLRSDHPEWASLQDALESLRLPTQNIAHVPVSVLRDAAQMIEGEWWSDHEQALELRRYIPEG